jgi:hypothetical protein
MAAGMIKIKLKKPKTATDLTQIQIKNTLKWPLI